MTESVYSLVTRQLYPLFNVILVREAPLKNKENEVSRLYVLLKRGEEGLCIVNTVPRVGVSEASTPATSPIHHEKSPATSDSEVIHLGYTRLLAIASQHWTSQVRLSRMSLNIIVCASSLHRHRLWTLDLEHSRSEVSSGAGAEAIKESFD